LLKFSNGELNVIYRWKEEGKELEDFSWKWIQTSRKYIRRCPALFVVVLVVSSAPLSLQRGQARGVSAIQREERGRERTGSEPHWPWQLRDIGPQLYDNKKTVGLFISSLDWFYRSPLRELRKKRTEDGEKTQARKTSSYHKYQVIKRMIMVKQSCENR
jgi:hypothetical protein